MNKTVLCLLAFALIASMGTWGCESDSTTDDPAQGKPESNGKEAGGKADAWNSTNNPSRFQLDLNYELAALPQGGKSAQTPWPDTYWPTFKDSTNQRWQGMDKMSPLEKYDMAFNGWEPGEGFGDLRPFNPSRCESGFDPEYYEKLGPAAAYQSQHKGNLKARDGVDSDGDGETDECDDNDGVESWWGLCHAWVPASILEKEPQHAVTYNGVTFEVGDIKGLLQTIYDENSALMLGGRCNEKEVKRDEEGRLTQSQCRDTNAGSFHVVLTNMLGIHQRSFAEDRTFDYQVWNQPFDSYEVLSLETVDAQTAMTALGIDNAENYTFNSESVRFAKVRTKVKYLTEPHQTTTYPLVPMVEEDGRFLGTDTYQYILEMDADGKILGGEWIGYSRTTHPDFLWLPIRARGGNPHVDIDMVRELLKLATDDGGADGGADDTRIATFENATVVEIPDATPDGIFGTIEINEDIEIGSLKVAVEIEHTYIGDLKITLERGGQKFTLHNREGGGANDMTKTFQVDGFNGQSARGVWSLLVSDNAGEDVGSLKKWKLMVSTSTPLPKMEFAAGGLPLEIPDNDEAGIESTLSVEEESSIGKLEVKIDLTHTYVSDLVVTLKHGGTAKTLHSREGGSSDDIVKTFTVDGFSGSPLQGDWKLFVSDNVGQDVGTLNAWSLIATTQ